MTIFSWYCESREFNYFDILHIRNSKFQIDRLKLIVKPDFSDASLDIIYSFEPDHYQNLFGLRAFQSYRICEDTTVSFWSNFDSDNHKCGVNTGSTSALFSWDWPHGTASLDSSRSLCPASGRFVYFTSGDGDVRIVVVDLI
jgi:hypothetical protein